MKRREFLACGAALALERLREAATVAKSTAFLKAVTSPALGLKGHPGNAFAAVRAARSSGGADLWDYLLEQLDHADQERRSRLATVRSRAQLEQMQENVRRVLMEGIGAFPERTPLNVKPTGTITHHDYLIEKLIFESRPEYYVTANLYRPRSASETRPVVVQDCGHYWEGKAAPDYQRACIGLVKKGFVVLIFDPMGLGERRMYRDSSGKPVAGGTTIEHFIAGRPCLLMGITLANYRIWDIMRAFDYLESCQDVDPARMGLLGHSGGGMMTLLTAPLEPRVRAAVSCCAVTSFYHKSKALLNADPEQVVPRILQNGVDHPELLATVAPRAFLIGAVLRDTVPLDGTRRTYEEAKPLFEVAGVPDHLGKVESDNVHLLDRTLREGCYAWMLKHLAGETGDATEPEIEIETEADLRCTPSGCVMDLPKSKSVFDLNRSRSDRLAEERNQRAPRLSELQAALASPSPETPKEREGYIESEPGIKLGFTLSPARSHGGALIILAAERGRHSLEVAELAHQFVAAGCSACNVDLRGWGEATGAASIPELMRNPAWREEFLAFRGFELGRPLLGMRVYDMLSVARAMSDGFHKVYFVGVEGAGVVALHAAALDRSVAGVATYRTLFAWQDVLEHPLYAEPAASFVPGALIHYDLSDLTKMVLPRPCFAVEAYNANRHPTQPSSGAAAPEILKGFGLL